MIPTSPICNVCEYSQCGVKCPPTAAQAAKGLNPLGSLPSQLWNSLWHDANEAVNCIKYATDTLIDEINNVLTEAGIAADVQCTDQLFQAIACIIHAVDTTGGKSSVKSSTTPGMVSIDQCGYMTVNNVGNTNCLNTTCKEVIGALNEINTTYGNAYGSLWQDTCTAEAAKAGISHSVNGSTYGIGSALAYGHLRISNTCNALVADCQRTAASQKAVADIWTVVSATAGLGNTVGSAFGTASAGSLFSAARSDHVHPTPNAYCAGALCGIPISPTCRVEYVSQGTAYTIGWDFPLQAIPYNGWCTYIDPYTGGQCGYPLFVPMIQFDGNGQVCCMVEAYSCGWRAGNQWGVVVGRYHDDESYCGPITMAVFPGAWVPLCIHIYNFTCVVGMLTYRRYACIECPKFIPGSLIGGYCRYPLI